ncbi:UNVERIFIED_CONTAM: hypothetical protein GTU68_001318 [Idotea baltica]|nr:hypothetical protein [Idotea baltica]
MVSTDPKGSRLPPFEVTPHHSQGLEM